MKLEMIDLVIFGNFIILCVIVGSIFTDISSKNEEVVESQVERLERIEVMASDIDLKMGLILEEVKELKED